MVSRYTVLLVALVATKAAGAFRIGSCNSIPLRGKTHRVDATPDCSLLDINAENVEKVLDLVRPQLASDGGGVSLVSIDDHEVKVKFEGACKGCPHRIGTVKAVIEATFVRFLKARDGKQITVKLDDQ